MSSTRKHKAADGDEGEGSSPSSSPRSSPHRAKSPSSSSGNKKRRLDTNGSDESTATTSSSSSSTSTSSSVFPHPALHQLPPHLLNHSHPGGDLGESLRFSQVARLLDASAEDGGLGLGHSSSGLGTSTDSSFWKMLYALPSLSTRHLSIYLPSQDSTCCPPPMLFFHFVVCSLAMVLLMMACSWHSIMQGDRGPV